MKCEECQDLLLKGDEPADQPLDVAAHLAECAACQEWHVRLLTLESNVPRLPVPSSLAGERIRRLFLDPAAPLSVPDAIPTLLPPGPSGAVMPSAPQPAVPPVRAGDSRIENAATSMASGCRPASPVRSDRSAGAGAG